MTGQGGAAHRRRRSFWRWPLPALRKVRLRTWTVLAMVIFAVLGAVTAYRGARTEQDAVDISEKLAGGQLIEVGERQRLYTRTASAAGLWAREDAVWWEGQALAKNAAQARQERRIEDAAWLAMRAHEEFAAARAIRLIREQLGAYKLSADEENLGVTATLAEFGFGGFVQFRPAESANKPGAAKPEGAKPEGARLEGARSEGEPKCHPSGGMELSQIWCETRTRLEDLHERVRHSSLAVTVFVLALAFFTVSDASVKARWRLFKWGFFAAGLATGAIAIVLAKRDPDAWPWLAAGLVATPLVWLGLHYVVAYAERKGWVHPEKDGEGSIHSEELMVERGALRAPVLGHHLEHWFGIVTIVLVAAAVFASAAVGWGYSFASTHADGSAEEARKRAAEMVIRTALFSSRQSELVRELAATAERRSRLGLANQRVQLSKFGAAMKGRHEDEEARHADGLRTYKAQFNDLELLMDADGLSFDDDPNFPNRLLWQFLRVPATDTPPRDAQARGWRAADERGERSRNAYEAFAQWGLASSRSVAWRNVASSLLAGLMTFAIALYFLGQALAMGPTRSGYVLLVAGIAFGGIGIASSVASSYPMIGLAGIAEDASDPVDGILAKNNCPAIYSEFSAGPQRREELAAYFYGIGVVLGDYSSDDDDLRRAGRYLGCALALREDFAYARLKLADVKSRLGSLDLAERYTSLPVRERVQTEVELAEARDRLQQSRLELSASQRNSLVFESALGALIARDDLALGHAEKVALRALDGVKKGESLARSSTAGMLAFNLGFVQLARGRFDRAREAYRDGLAAESSDAFRLSALTDLEIVWMLRCKDEKAAAAAHFDCTGLGRAIVDIHRTLLDHRRGADAATARPLPSQEDFAVSATAGHLSARVRGFDPKVDDLWLVWSRLEPSWDSWRTLQRVSVPITSPRKGDNPIVVQPRMVDVRHSFLRSYWGTKACLAEGRYRADLYAHGRLVATRALERATPTMKPARFRELNLQLCMPREWSVIPEQAAAARQRSNYGFIRGMKNGAGTPVAFVFSLYVPLQPDGLSSCLVPGNAVSCAFNTLAAGKVIAGNEPLVAWEGMTAGLDRRALIYRSWTTQDGGVHVVLARADSATPEQLRDLLESAEVIYDEDEIDTTLQPK